jgi:hypothetical protein
MVSVRSMIDDNNILEEVRILKEERKTARAIANELSRRHSNYFKNNGRKRSVNFSTWDVLQGLALLRKAGELPQRGKLRSNAKKP